MKTSFYFVVWILIILTYGSFIEAQALAYMIFLYGALATYFGVKDFITIVQTFRNKLIKTTNYEKA